MDCGELEHVDGGEADCVPVTGDGRSQLRELRCGALLLQ
ncbi:unnamed protein product [Heligmosomoides polygyrus]|uniref:Uncharacterized protein n=1 Tax=Heligmosomoides polygyrus TaxID=6339 RepID=A0A183FAP6_HELPZ|nr:unnamed protein product [Heligmosomoides polygyrus]